MAMRLSSMHSFHKPPATRFYGLPQGLTMSVKMDKSEALFTEYPLFLR